MIKKLGIALAFFGSMGVASAQEDQNLTFLTLGVESVQYDENTSGITASGSPMNNMIQRSSSYTHVDDDFGFYITTNSTLLANQKSESWNLSPYGIVQTNQRKVILTDIALDGAWNIGNGLQITGGLGMNTMSFSRASFKYPQGTQGTIAVNANNQVTSFTANNLGSYQQVSPSTAVAPALYNGRILARSPGAVFEDSTSILGQVGVKYDSFFLDDSGLRLLGGLRVGIPLYYYVTNSGYSNMSWTSSFKGYNLHADLGIGFEIANHFDFIVIASGDYRYRPQTNTVGRAFIPNVKVTVLRTTAGLSWDY